MEAFKIKYNVTYSLAGVCVLTFEEGVTSFANAKAVRAVFMSWRR